MEVVEEVLEIATGANVVVRPAKGHLIAWRKILDLFLDFSARPWRDEGRGRERFGGLGTALVVRVPADEGLNCQVITGR